jgi:hypothetical protein
LEEYFAYDTKFDTDKNWNFSITIPKHNTCN